MKHFPNIFLALNVINNLIPIKMNVAFISKIRISNSQTGNLISNIISIFN